MNSMVIYGSRYGNTQKIAEAIADALRSRGAVQVLPADEAPARLPVGIDLVVVGGPTEGHGMTEPVTRFFEHLGPGALVGTAAAAFDTRLRWPRWLSGSAGAGITQRLRGASARVIAPEESFFVKGASGARGTPPAIEPGELVRATAWAVALADQAAPRAPAMPGAAR